ncbi:unnamed protein product [Leptidea sinapis]|uniref:Major facilitator superfamily (MFS) profile domain-containing protein n=1 Tax=Leptidea sinapis TaxID=189913 RepID=A0A5E4QPP0_9NEOP|nr:unnamed protein product [Leptidea sinapis]
MSAIRQAGFTAIVGYLGLSMGIVYSWPSSTLRLFSSTNTTLDRPMTETELALFGSLSSIAALVSVPCAGFLVDVLGRKYSCVLFSLPQVIAWAMICCCYKVELILAALFISGFGGCIFMIVPMFICEFCQETIRGMMTPVPIIFYGLGMLLSYVFGGCLEYATMNYVSLSLAVIGLFLMGLMKESPTFLMKKGLEKEAAESIAYFRGVKVSSKLVTQELNTIRRALNPDFEMTEDAISEEEKLKPSMTTEKLSFWQFIKKSRSTRRALMLCLVLYTASIFQGLVVVQVYAEPLFEEAVPNISTTLSSVLFAIIVIVSGLMASYLMEKAGRRPLLIYSSAVSGVACLVLGSQIQFHWGPHWISAIFLYTYCIAYSVGPAMVPFVLVAEVFLPEVKSIVSVISVEWAWICNFIILFIFNPLVAAVGLGPVFYLFSAVCFATVVFCIFFLPETKGLTVDVIQTLFVRRRGAPVI